MCNSWPARHTQVLPEEMAYRFYLFFHVGIFAGIGWTADMSALAFKVRKMQLWKA